MTNFLLLRTSLASCCCCCLIRPQCIGFLHKSFHCGDNSSDVMKPNVPYDSSSLHSRSQLPFFAVRTAEYQKKKKKNTSFISSYITFLYSLYNLHSHKKCSTDSQSVPQAHTGESFICVLKPSSFNIVLFNSILQYDIPTSLVCGKQTLEHTAGMSCLVTVPEQPSGFSSSGKSQLIANYYCVYMDEKKTFILLNQ